MSQTYPLMRGTAPLVVALVSVFRMGDVLSPIAWAGVLGICLGVCSIALGNGLQDRKGVYLALVNAVVIAGYTLIDGVGVRRSGAPAAYTLWVFLLTGVPLTVWAASVRRAEFFVYFGRHWRLGIAGGVGTTVSYGLALWAMTVAPVAIVAAMRETSIVFGTLIGGSGAQGTRRPTTTNFRVYHRWRCSPSAAGLKKGPRSLNRVLSVPFRLSGQPLCRKAPRVRLIAPGCISLSRRWRGKASRVCKGTRCSRTGCERRVGHRRCC